MFPRSVWEREGGTVVRLLLSALVLFAIVLPCGAQIPQAGGGLKQIGTSLNPPPYGQRTDAFRRLLFEFHFEPLKEVTDLLVQPDKSILLLLGDMGAFSANPLPEGLQAFVRQGGAVLIATDREIPEPFVQEVVKLTGVRVTGEKLLQPTGTDVYAHELYCPIVQPIAGLAPLGGSSNVLDALAAVVGAGNRPALFRSLNPSQPDDLRVATNAPSRLRENWWGLPGGIYRLAQLPPGCVDEIHAFAPIRQRPSADRPLFAVGGSVGAGRVLVLADHSVFINRMMLYTDNNNLEFTANCLHWLRGGASTPMEALHAAQGPQPLQKLAGQRDRVLFWDDGRIHKNFEVPLRKVPIKPSIEMGPALVAAVDQTLAKMEERDEFNREVMDRIDDLPGGRPGAVRNVLYLLTLLSSLLLGYVFFWRGRVRQESAVPLLAHAVSQHEPRASVLELRRRAMVRSGNVWELAHELARQYFSTAGISLTNSSPPRVSVQGGWWQRRRVRRRVKRLWQLARGDVPARIAPAALPLWLRELEQLKTALANGTIQLT